MKTLEIEVTSQMFRAKAGCVALAISAALFSSDAFAQILNANRCDTFATAKERAWFGDAQLPRRESGARLRTIDRAVELELQPTPNVSFFLPPEKEPKPDSFSGDVTFFGVPKAGLYQVTVSKEALIDVFENGTRLKAIDQVSGKECPGIGEGVRFDLAPGDLVLVEVIGAPTRTIKVAFAEAQ